MTAHLLNPPLMMLMLMLMLGLTPTHPARPAEPTPEPAPAPALLGNDLPFEAATEQFVADALRERGSDISLNQVLSERSALALRALGANQWHARELAERVLAEHAADPGTRRALIWGTFCSDPEVQMRSEGLLNRLYRCGGCRGTGICGTCGGHGWLDQAHGWPCTDCGWSRAGTWLCRACNGTGAPRP